MLDVGGGIGGPARTLVAEFGCVVTLVDPTETFVHASEALTAQLGLSDRLTHRIGSALELPFEDGSFDAIWTQNSGMNIADKERLYAEFYRVVPPGGRLAIQEPIASPVQPIIFPIMWAQDESTSFLRTAGADAGADRRRRLPGAGLGRHHGRHHADRPGRSGPQHPAAA